jgi:two-component system, LytTR family, sensor kinase
MKKIRLLYWWCQLGGWTSYVLVFTLLYQLTSTRPMPPYFYLIVISDAILGLLLTHLMRFAITELKILQQKFQVQVMALLGFTICFAFVLSVGSVITDRIMGWENEKMSELSIWTLAARSLFTNLVFLLIWNLIYFTYHYVEKSRKEQVDKIRLEATVKELELQTIKAHINPHFIFNALNSIRALVDENPPRARTAITELSNILRSSMKSDKQPTAPLEAELNIVKDYLALEQIRFEDRLKIEYDIDEDTLDQPVPPMMLQTLVENAIKHGISKQKEGGTIRIVSDYVNNHYELRIINTGQLNGSTHFITDGFGIPGTKSRLKLLYGDKAIFTLSNLTPEMVEATIKLPITNN